MCSRRGLLINVLVFVLGRKVKFRFFIVLVLVNERRVYVMCVILGEGIFFYFRLYDRRRR